MKIPNQKQIRWRENKLDELITFSQKRVDKVYKKVYKDKKDYLLYVYLLLQKKGITIYQWDKYHEFIKIMQNSLGNKLYEIYNDDFLELYMVMSDWFDQFDMKPKNKAAEVINQPWVENTGWQIRVARHQVNLANRIAQVIDESQKKGLDDEEFNRRLQETYARAAAATNVLTETEMSHINNAVTQQVMEEYDIDKWQWIAHHDCKTCAECMKKDRKIFGKQDSMPPEHPRCRCYSIPYIKQKEE